MADKELTAAEALKIVQEKNARAAELKAKRDAAREARSGETKRDAFKRISTKRVNDVLNAIATLRGLTAPENYDYTKDDWNKIFGAINDGLKKVADKVENPAIKTDSGFSLD